MNIQSARFAFLLSALSLSAVSSGGIEICPSISLGIDNPAPVCSMESMTVGAWFTELPGLCREVPVTYLDKQWTWVVEGVEATPSSGKGSSATFTNITGGEGSITFALRCRVRACEDCNTTFAITTNFTAIKVDIAESNVVLCSYDTSATLSLTGDSYSPSGFVWNSTLWKKSKDGASVSFDPSTKPPGIYTVRASSRSRSACSDVCQVSIVRVDLDVDSNLDGVCDEADELLEDGSGRLVGVNNDDDNANGTNDLDEAGVVVGENDLVPIYLKIDPKMPTGMVILDAPSGGDKIRVWKSASKDEEVHLPMTWYPAAGTVPEVRYIEGIQPSDQSGDVQLRLRYLVGSVECTDEISMSLLKVELAIDGEHDPTASMNFADPAYQTCTFWVNDDIDVNSGGEEDDANTGTPDCNDDAGAITCRRDLEDFTRLHIRVDNNAANLSGITYWLKFENGLPSANIFAAVNESMAYLQDGSAADQQLQKVKLLTVDGTELQLPSQYIKTGNQVSPFILEGKTEGQGELTFIVKVGNSEVFRKAVSLDLHPIKWFYDIYNTDIVTGSDSNQWTVQVQNYTHSNTAQYPAGTDDYLLYVHGWNMFEWEKERWAETAFKRLWWQGYKGKLGLFSWPTLSGFDWQNALWNTHHFDTSEFRSWVCADNLASCFGALNGNGKLRVLAHSMGNVVAGESLRKYTGAPINAFVGSQAALSANFYDITATIPSIQQGFILPPVYCPISTPNIIGHYHSGDANRQPYLAVDTQKATRWYNYHNSLDYALRGNHWELDVASRPDNWLPLYFGYEGREDQYDEVQDHFYRWLGDDPGGNPIHGNLSVTIERQRYEVFSYCAESRVRALGAIEGVAGFQSFNLRSAPLNYNAEHYSHSRQFRSNAIDEYAYWHQLKIDCGF